MSGTDKSLGMNFFPTGGPGEALANNAVSQFMTGGGIPSEQAVGYIDPNHLMSGKYSIVGQLSAGSRPVYLVLQGQTQHYAAKIFGNDQDACLGEYEALFKLQFPGSPYIVGAVEMLQDDMFGAVLIRDYVAGKTLREMMQELSFDEQTWSLFISNILDGLAYSHDKGLVHCDLKPTNIIFDDSDQIFKILDFGIAKQDRCDGHTAYHEAGQGTVYYMAPEQLKGGKVSPQADFYAFAVIMYEMLTNELPIGVDAADVFASKAARHNHIFNIEALKKILLANLSQVTQKRHYSAKSLKEALLKCLVRAKQQVHELTQKINDFLAQEVPVAVNDINLRLLSNEQQTAAHWWKKVEKYEQRYCQAEILAEKAKQTLRGLASGNKFRDLVCMLENETLWSANMPSLERRQEEAKALLQYATMFNQRELDFLKNLATGQEIRALIASEAVNLVRTTPQTAPMRERAQELYAWATQYHAGQEVLQMLANFIAQNGPSCDPNPSQVFEIAPILALQAEAENARHLELPVQAARNKLITKKRNSEKREETLVLIISIWLGLVLLFSLLGAKPWVNMVSGGLYALFGIALLIKCLVVYPKVNWYLPLRMYMIASGIQGIILLIALGIKYMI